MELKDSKETKVKFLSLAPFLFKEPDKLDTKSFNGRKTIAKALKSLQQPKLLLSIPLQLQDGEASGDSPTIKSTRKRKSSSSNNNDLDVLGGQDLEKPMDNDTLNKAKRVKKTKPELNTTKKQRKDDIRSIVELIKFANELNLGEGKKRDLEELVTKISVKSLSPVVGNETDNMNCEMVIKRFATWDNNPPEANPPRPNDPDDGKSVEEMSQPDAITSTLTRLADDFPEAKIKLLTANVNLIAQNTGYNKGLPEKDEFEKHSTGYIVFQVDNVRKFKSAVFPPDIRGKKKEDEGKNKAKKQWILKLQEKLHKWKDGGWICNLEVMNMTKDLKFVVLYKYETHRELFPLEHDLFESDSSDD